MKDVIGCEKLWSGVNNRDESEISEWDNLLCIAECISCKHGKWNISVPWGKKIVRDSLSSDERTGTSPNHIHVKVLAVVYNGVDESIVDCLVSSQRVIKKHNIKRSTWEGASYRVTVPYRTMLSLFQ